MTKIRLIALLIIVINTGVSAQVIPQVKLTRADGSSFQTRQLNGISGKPVVLAFWATWCKPCLNELNAINENLDEWEAESKFEFYAISEDDSRSSAKVNALINGKRWKFNVLLDKNQDLTRGLNIQNIPYLIVVKNGKIIYRHSGYTEGSENELYRVIKENQ